MRWTLKKVLVKDLKENEKNPRILTEKGLNDLEQRIKKFGLAEPLVVNTNMTICGGHGRKVILERLKIEKVDCYFPERLLTEKEFTELGIRLNKNIAGEFNFDILKEIIDDIDIDIDLEDLTDWGFEEDEFEFEKEEVKEDDFNAELSKEAITKLGDLYELNEHRLHCADSTDSDAVSKLMDGKKADMVFTDPPYGVSYSARTGIRSGKIRPEMEMIKNDDLENDDLEKLLYDSINNAILFTKSEASFYVCNNWHCANLFKKVLQGLFLKLDAWIVWNKDWMSVGHGNYRSNHEFIFYINRGGKFYAKKGIENDVWTIRKLSPDKKEHTTQKPIELIARAINNSSIKKNIVVDIYLGSGSTLIASEQLGRICYGQELDEKYCDVILRRYIKYMTDNNKEFIIKRNGQILSKEDLLKYTK